MEAWLPPLNAIKPMMRMNPPRDTKGRECAVIGTTFPSLKRPARGPRMNAPWGGREQKSVKSCKRSSNSHSFSPLPSLTDECGHSASKVDHSAAGKVSDSALREPTLPRPEPVSGDRVNDGGHESAEDDVTVEVAALGDGSGDDGGAGGGKGALNQRKGKWMRSYAEEN